MQLKLFEEEKKPGIHIDKPIRLIELFGGYGSQSMAMRNIGADFVPWKLVEFDRFAVASYNAVHGTHFETTDIRGVHGNDLEITGKDKYCYFMFYSFPCTDLSVAGKMAGMSKGSGTRSGLLWEVERILYELKGMDSLPQMLCCENVPQIVSTKNKPDFDLWCKSLADLGYFSTWRILNAKDYGVPQNRNRFFMLSFLGKDYEYEWPEPVPLTRRLKDVLEDEVDEKYYINNEKADRLIQDLEERGVIGNETVKTNGKDIVKKIDIATTFSARDSKGFSESFQCMNGVVERTENSCGGGGRKCVDLTVNSPKEREVANCIIARTDCGISNLLSTGTGVVENWSSAEQQRNTF